MNQIFSHKEIKKLKVLNPITPRRKILIYLKKNLNHRNSNNNINFMKKTFTKSRGKSFHSKRLFKVIKKKRKNPNQIFRKWWINMKFKSINIKHKYKDNNPIWIYLQITKKINCPDKELKNPCIIKNNNMQNYFNNIKISIHLTNLNQKINRN